MFDKDVIYGGGFCCMFVWDMCVILIMMVVELLSVDEVCDG